MKYEIRFDGDVYFEYETDLGQREINYIKENYSVRLVSTRILTTPKGTVKQYNFEKEIKK